MTTNSRTRNMERGEGERSLKLELRRKADDGVVDTRIIRPGEDAGLTLTAELYIRTEEIETPEPVAAA